MFKSGRPTTGTILIAGAIGAVVMSGVAAWARCRAARREFLSTDARVDKNLKDTFPASDPAAPHFVGIPVNRQ